MRKAIIVELSPCAEAFRALASLLVQEFEGECFQVEAVRSDPFSQVIAVLVSHPALKEVAPPELHPRAQIQVTREPGRLDRYRLCAYGARCDGWEWSSSLERVQA